MKCSECGYENREGARFCLECGAKLENVCPQCGAKLPSEAKFCDECGTRLAGVVSPSTNVAVPKLEDMHAQLQNLIPDALAQKYISAEQQATGENRPITALFADISGFTPMSANQTSEVMFQLVQDCFKELVSIVANYEGSISGFRGDGLLALFGAPILHENDAERAILAAMDMQDTMQERQLQVSIGINTAMMTVGEIQTQLHKEYTAYGTDINLAKRLQEAAEPGQILVGIGTHRLTRRIFDFQALPDLSVRGFQEAVTAYIVQQVKEHPEKLRGIEGLRARMIGREREFSELKETADLWLGGQGQIVSIVGEAGIGKSRLARELREYLRERRGEGASVPVSILEGRCVSIGQPIGYWPFIDILSTYLGLSEEDDEPTRASKVTESITHLMPRGADETLPLLGNLLSIRFGSELDDRLKFASPEQIRHQTLMRLRDLFETLAERQPLLLILEDLHWADDLSLDLVSLLMDELANTPLMLLCVYRPEREHRVWQLSDQARRKCLDRYTELRLNPLSTIESRQLVELLLEIENLPEATKDTILIKSEGNPFFIEEVIRSLIEQGMIYHEDDHWRARDEIAAISVPDTIQSVVLARVDRLQAEARYVLQCASVIGRLFRYRLLRHISHQEEQLDGYLTEFEERELVYEERTVPELEYAFKHAFTQEATYEGILEQQRREFHHQVAIGIERLYQERLDEYYEELAYHYSRSKDTDKAVEYLLKAGEKAEKSYANEVAISHFQKALEMLEQVGIERNDWKLAALRGLAEVYFGVGRIAEAGKTFEEAITLAKEMKLPPRQLAKLYYWSSDALHWQKRYDEEIRYGEMGLEILGDDMECLEVALMNSLIAVGNRWSRKGDREKYREYTRRNMAFIKKLEYSEELRSPYVHIITVAHEDGDLENTWEWTRELETRADQHHDLRGLASAWLYQANFALRSKGDCKNSLLLLKKSLDMFERIGDHKHAGWCYRDIAGILLNSGNIEEAHAHVRVYLKLAEQTGAQFDIPNAHRRLGDIVMCLHCWEEAIFHYHRYPEGRQATAHFLLGRAYLKKGDHYNALQSFQEAGGRAIETQEIGLLSNAFGGIEKTYMALGTPEKFAMFCRSFKEQHADVVKTLPLHQWHLEPVKPSEEFPHLAFADDFETETIPPSQAGMLVPPWDWIDEFGDCAVAQHSMLAENQDRILGYPPSHGLDICAANGRDLDGLNLSAPRLMREISEDFAVEVCVSPALDNELVARSTEKPQMGGLLVWKAQPRCSTTSECGRGYSCRLG